MNKAQVTELTTRLRDAAKLQDPVARACIDVVRAYVDMAKESLVAADGDDMLRAQGAVRHLEKMLKELTIDPPQLRRMENT